MQGKNVKLEVITTSRKSTFMSLHSKVDCWRHRISDARNGRVFLVLKTGCLSSPVECVWPSDPLTVTGYLSLRSFCHKMIFGFGCYANSVSTLHCTVNTTIRLSITNVVLYSVLFLIDFRLGLFRIN